MAQYVFPKVEPVDIQRSRRDLSLYKPFTASVGTLVPCFSTDMLPGDWMRINTIATVQSMPMVAPVRGRWKVSFDYYYNPWSNIYGFMDNDTRLSTQQIVNMYRYTFHLGPAQKLDDIDNLGFVLMQLPKVPCGGVLDFLGCPIGYVGDFSNGTNSGTVAIEGSDHPAEGFITYLDIVRNYYVNNQLDKVPYLANNNPEAITSVVSETPYNSVTLEKLDDFILSLRNTSRKGLTETYNIFKLGYLQDYFLYSQGNNPTTSTGPQTMLPSFDIKRQCGLFLTNYRMDLLRGIMSQSVGEFKAKVNVEDVNGQTPFVSMDNVYFADKLQQFINRIDITGGRFTDWIRTRWNIDPGISVDRPIYLGSHSLWLNTIDVIATASGATNVGSRNDNSVLGQQVGYQVGKMTDKKQRPITIKSKQYGTLMCIFRIVPDVVYSEGFELNMLKTKFADIYDPAFKQLGFQDVLKAEMSVFPTIHTWYTTDSGSSLPDEYYWSVSNNITNKTSVGKRVAWSEYMGSLGRAHGEFASGMSLDYWVNNRRYYVGSSASRDTFIASLRSEVPASIPFSEEFADKFIHSFDATTYVYPHLWNTPFANIDIKAMNYNVDVYFQIDANRSLGKRVMPHM